MDDFWTQYPESLRKLANPYKLTMNIFKFKCGITFKILQKEMYNYLHMNFIFKTNFHYMKQSNESKKCLCTLTKI